MNEISELEDGDVRLKFRAFIKANKINMAAVAKEVPCARSHLKRILDTERPLQPKTLDRLNEILKTNF